MHKASKSNNTEHTRKKRAEVDTGRREANSLSLQGLKNYGKELRFTVVKSGSCESLAAKAELAWDPTRMDWVIWKQSGYDMVHDILEVG